ncbi:MAG TPA: AAA family ATPase [Rhabdochlamydiaceae bacterium]|nr:AAA family ATPase [Rhabdochlamydiaceae bacterium]
MKEVKKYLKLKVPEGQSIFLWGPRNSGKSTYLHRHFPDSVYYDLLQTDVYMRFLKEPFRLREEILQLSPEALKKPIIIDEVQKVPLLLSEVHWLIENHKPCYFILCSSSARKLKASGTHLLAGRAWKVHFYPLVYPEIENFDLLKALNHGLLPVSYFGEQPRRFLKSYIQDYLVEEIQKESLVRNLAGFSRFLDAVALTHGEMTNFVNISRDCGVDAKTVKEYYDILVDTLVGYRLDPFHKIGKRDVITATSKFYLFDVGVAGFLQGRTLEALKGKEAGAAFEHWLLTELIAYRGLNDLDFSISYWRTKSELEVDFILGDGDIAIKAKISSHVDRADLRGLEAFIEEHQPKQAYCVSRTPKARKIVLSNNTYVIDLPWQEFIEKLWNKEIIN